MHDYAQTNVQLYSQLRHSGYSSAELIGIRKAYELAICLYSGHFKPSGRTFNAHVVGTASILGSLHAPAQIVAAALIHNVYQNGDFGDWRKGISDAKRQEVRLAVGEEVEKYVARFATLQWNSATIPAISEGLHALDPIDRDVVLIHLADHLEHLVDLLYYADIRGLGYFKHNSQFMVQIARRLGYPTLAFELERVWRETSLAEFPTELHSGNHRGDYLIAPKSYRRRLAIMVGRALYDLRSTMNLLSILIKETGRAARIRRWIKKRLLAVGPLEARSECFVSLFPKDASLERVATGFRFTEGPVWLAEETCLLFSDIPGNQIFKLKPNGQVVTFRQPSGNANGLAQDREGRLIACEHSNRRVTRTEKDGSIAVLADQFQGKKLNSPNDVVVKSDSAVYFTDPSCGIKSDQQEQPIQGVYRLSPDGEQLTIVADDFEKPNGLAFSPDEKKLYVGDSQRRHIRVFDVQGDGTLSKSRIFFDMSSRVPGSPDGMKVDVCGHIYCTGPRGVWIFDAEGNHLGTIVTPETAANCAWGDDDGRGLYITAVNSIYKIRVNNPGIRGNCCGRIESIGG
jgi:gluconolactonase